MESPRRITEEDILVTEALIAESYGRLEQSVVQAQSRALRSVRQMTDALIAESYGRLEQSVVQAQSRALRSIEQTIREHPFETAAAAAVVGITAYALIKPMRPRVVFDKDDGQTHTYVKKAGYLDLMREILSVIIPLAVPYIDSYIQKYMGEIHPRERD